MLTIHGVPISVHARKVILAAKLKGLAYAIEPVIPFRPPEGWRAISPTGLIPVIEDDGFTLGDSTAICLYLDARHPQAPLVPAEAEARGRALWFDAYAGGSMFRGFIQGLLAQLVIGPRLFERATDDAEVARLRTEVEPAVFDYLESQMTGGWLVDGGLTIADLAVGSNLVNYRYLGFRVDGARYPKLAAYADRVVAERVFAEAIAAERPVAEQMGLDVTLGLAAA